MLSEMMFLSQLVKQTVLPYDKLARRLSPFSVNVHVHIEPSGNNFGVDKELVSPLYLHAKKSGGDVDMFI